MRGGRSGDHGRFVDSGQRFVVVAEAGGDVGEPDKVRRDARGEADLTAR
ncbi:MAG TPA: hypothetical protein VFQ44_29510 [Streptosporangiaceae bacterium]|nr:hypothetical protein [Streptosporangiaceae bacterium]